MFYVNPFRIIFFILITLLWTFLFFQVRPLQIIENEQPYPVITKTINAGEDLVIEVDYCKHLPAEISYYLQFYGVDTGEVVTTVPQQLSDLFVGCKKVNFHWHTPDTLASGRYFAVAHARYRLSWWQKIFYQYRYVTRTEDFEVVGSPPLREIIKEVSTIINNYFIEEIVNETPEEIGNAQEQENGPETQILPETSQKSKNKNK